MHGRARQLEVAAAVACMTAVITVVLSDGRRFPSTKTKKVTIPNATWWFVQESSMIYASWYTLNFRCTPATFEAIVKRVRERWQRFYDLPYPNTVFSIRDRVAIFLHYVTHKGSYYSSGQVLGASKTQARKYVNEVVLVLNPFVNEAIRLPQTDSEWKDVTSGFERMCGFPNVCGAIDGSLFPIKRFADFDGWYCRKGFTAFNIQVVASPNKRIMSFSIRNGSQNDQGIFKRSAFGRRCEELIPSGSYLVGDAGYQLLPYLLTPYPIVEGMSRSEKLYNHLHSKTRIVVEQTFGLLKGKFRIFRSELQHRTPETMAEIIMATFVVHNWFIDLHEDEGGLSDEVTCPDDEDLEPEKPSIPCARGKMVRDQLKEYLVKMRNF